MLLLSCTNLTHGYDATPLFNDVEFELHAGERVGFVGPNGAGKTTLMKLIAGDNSPDRGDIRLHAGARLGLLSQVAHFPGGRTLFDEAKSAFDELLATQSELVEVADKLARASSEKERKELSEHFDLLNELLSVHDAYALDHKVSDVLSGLGFSEADHQRDLSTFSGGQQRRVLLAKLLLAAPDVMLLDEPSNHLDIRTTRWLEDYLARQPQGMIVVSHDRYFLDRVCNKIFELHNQVVTSYPGNYKQYVRLRDERYERQMKEYEAQREYVLKQEEYIRRAGYGQLAKQAQSRAKALDKIEPIEKPTKVAGPHIGFHEARRAGDIVFSASDLTKKFGDLTLFENLNLDVPRGKRLGIMGPNGSGKTTLLKLLLGDETPTSGEVRRGHLVFPGYLDQHLKLLDEDHSVLRAVWPDPDPAQTEKTMRDLLGTFGISGEICERPVKQLSGGERSRAALAKLTVAGANVLVLDEPTNHLDIWACDSLEQALKAYDGTVIVVSHDRYFLNSVAEMMVVIENGKAEVVYGNYDTYELLLKSRAENPTPKKASPTTKDELKPASVPIKQKRKRKYPYRKPADVEAEIAKTESNIEQWEAALTESEIYLDPERLQQTLADIEEAKEKLGQLYEHWEEAMDLNT